MPFKLAPRLKSFDYTGFNRYFLTICTLDRHRAFVERSAVADVVSQLSQTSERECFSVPAYCLMPDHFHALLEGERVDANLQRFVRLFKQRSSFHWKRRTGNPLWQRGYFEHVLRAEEDTFDVARYILDNPVRAGLVSRPEDYPFLGSLSMTVRDLLYSVQINNRRT